MTYHVRRTDRAITDPAIIGEMMNEGRFITFALCDGSEPYVVTLSYGHDAENSRLYFHVAREGMKLDVIATNPRACGTVVLAGEYLDGECAHPYRSVVLRGTIRMVEDSQEKSRALRTLVDHLESDPDGYWQGRGLDDSKKMSGFRAMCFDIEHITAKTGS